VPILFLTLLYEIRVRPDVDRSLAGIILGFVGDLVVAAAAIVLEFALLGTLQHPRGVTDGAAWIWVVSSLLLL
jgi:hypothetical protein